MGVADVYKVSRIDEGRSMQRAIAACALAVMKSSTAERVLKATWPRDEHARLLVKGAVSPTKNTGFGRTLATCGASMSNSLSAALPGAMDRNAPIWS